MRYWLFGARVVLLRRRPIVAGRRGEVRFNDCAYALRAATAIYNVPHA